VAPPPLARVKIPLPTITDPTTTDAYASIETMVLKVRTLASVVVTVACVGCTARARNNDPPARLTVGASMRQFPAIQEPDATPAAFRSSEPQPTANEGSAQTARMAAIAFTMQTPLSGVYAGGEVETGALDPGSSAASVYGVIGARQRFANLNLGVELVAGRRWLRYIDHESASMFAAEPRLRADIWLDEQFSLGGAVGLTLGDQTVWMAGVFLGIHSHAFR
jgi:hypothetical protein